MKKTIIFYETDKVYRIENFNSQKEAMDFVNEQMTLDYWNNQCSYIIQDIFEISPKDSIVEKESGKQKLIDLGLTEKQVKALFG